ncbi:MAG: 7-carboxy-7-deazaguanine synthase QueE [Muribaculaceae bacterium]|nr:7-carboxy-7-deazaguanine synthase QueE [Muribaculaceae bacterium]
MRKINEIFYSLQGEGHHSGYPSVFIRFSGCNLKCSFCDTNHEEGILMDDDEIIRAVKLYSADWIVITGGEPALRIDKDFISLLKRATGKKIAVETNGTVPLPEGIDWVTVSPKFGIETPDGAEMDGRTSVKVAHADEIKVVDIGQDLEPYFNLPCKGDKTLMYLQPCYVADPDEFRKNRLRTVSRVLADPRWTLSVQLHRFLGIP